MVPMLEENKQGFCKRYPNRWLGLSHMIFFVVVLQSGRFLSVFMALTKHTVRHFGILQGFETYGEVIKY